MRRNSCFDPREMCLHSYLLVGHNSNSVRVIKTERAILNIKCKVLGNINTSMTVIPSIYSSNTNSINYYTAHSDRMNTFHVLVNVIISFELSNLVSKPLVF